jgi:type II secretory pathway pseudopilin PulG
MQDKQVAGFFLEIWVVVVILGLLAAITLPNVGKMLGKSRDVSAETELQNVQTAVTEMLCDSEAGTLEPVGPTGNLSEVHTCDIPPLYLSDYLLGDGDGTDELVCTYSFAADGTVDQIEP